MPPIKTVRIYLHRWNKKPPKHDQNHLLQKSNFSLCDPFLVAYLLTFFTALGCITIENKSMLQKPTTSFPTK